MPETTEGLEAALAGASARTWAERARAGCALAPVADVPQAAEALLRLLLDAEDTAVTRRVAEALTRAGTAAAVRLVALALEEAGDSQADWLQTGVDDALAGTDDAAGVMAVCARLARDPEAAVRRGAAHISAWADRSARTSRPRTSTAAWRRTTSG
ncbi:MULTISPECIES: hypothetical protein [Streptomyces]|uniref:hypothetical protein n=1 Tax=Streptomyces TaxID=1883 RepID=UPI001CCA9E66|nr:MULTISPECIES: hypothetical protein [Streptomyces]UBI35710.1 hypothetical protein K7I03_04015 [Streptomyces mobaraensis]UKW28303.1 hypothetical protein MCU78_04030 [Streptomyces sp. TYQ1024]